MYLVIIYYCSNQLVHAVGGLNFVISWLCSLIPNFVCGVWPNVVWLLPCIDFRLLVVLVILLTFLFGDMYHACFQGAYYAGAFLYSV